MVNVVDEFVTKMLLNNTKSVSEITKLCSDNRKYCDKKRNSFSKRMFKVSGYDTSLNLDYIELVKEFTNASFKSKVLDKGGFSDIDNLLVLSPSMTKYLAVYGSRDANAFLLSNGINLSEIKDISSSFLFSIKNNIGGFGSNDFSSLLDEA